MISTWNLKKSHTTFNTIYNKITSKLILLQKQIEKLQNQIQQVILEKDEAIQDKIQQEKETEKAKTLR